MSIHAHRQNGSLENLRVRGKLFDLILQNVTNGINYSTMREISLLKQLRDHDCFVRLLDVLEVDEGG